MVKYFGGGRGAAEFDLGPTDTHPIPSSSPPFPFLLALPSLSLTFGVARILNEAVVDAEWREEALPALLTRIITELVGTRVTAETVTFATPVLAAAAKRHDDVGVQRGVVAVIREHADLGDSLPRRALVDILCSLLSVSAVAADAHVGLVELSRGLGAEDAEALLNGFTASSSSVRFSSVSAFAASEGCLAVASRPDVAAKIFLLTHEGEGECADAANALWADCGLVVDFDPQVYYIPLLSDAYASFFFFFFFFFFFGVVAARANGG